MKFKLRLLSVMMITALIFSSMQFRSFASSKPALANNSCSIVIGGSKTIKVRNISKKAVIRYSSSKKSVAKVSKKGKVTGLKAGKAKITVVVKNGSKKKKLIYKVTVKKPAFSQNSIEIRAGTTKKVSIVNKPKTAAKIRYIWSSDNPLVASVSGSTVTAKEPGHTTIRVKLFKGKKLLYKLSCSVTVTASSNPEINDNNNNNSNSNSSNSNTDTGNNDSNVSGDNKFTVTFQDEDGSIIASQKVEKGKSAVRPENPQKKDYLFGDWYTESSFNTRYNFKAAVTADTILYARWFKIIDNDNDGMPDSVINEETFEIDTDGDGLTDHQEYTLTNTNPFLADSDGDGVTDDAVDADADGLNNKEEISNNTNPLLADTEEDGLSDYKEVMDLKTDPNESDTDKDGLSDYDEVQLGLDPLNPKTDGTTPDGERTFDAKLSEEAIDESLVSDNLMIPGLELNDFTGNINSNATIEESSSDLFGDQRFIIGKPVDITVDNEVISGTVTFDFDRSRVSEDETRDYIICKVTDGDYSPLDTSVDYDAGVLSASISENGTYMVINMKDFLTSIGFSDDALFSMSVAPEIPDNPTALHVNAESLYETLEAEEIRYYSITPEETSYYGIYCNSDETELKVLLYDSSCELIDSSDVRTAQFNYTLNGGETYYLAVACRYVYDTGSFSIGVQENEFGENGLPLKCEEIAFGETTNAVINVEGSTSYFKYRASASESVKFYSLADADTYGLILDSDGNIIASDDDGGTDGNFMISTLLEEGQLYYFGVRYYSSYALGEIPFVVEKWDAELDADSLNDIEDPTSFTIELSEYQEYVLSFIPDHTGDYRLTSDSDTDTYVTLRDETGDTIASDDDSGIDYNFDLVTTLEEGHRYYFFVKSISDSYEGSVKLSFTELDASYEEEEYDEYDEVSADDEQLSDKEEITDLSVPESVSFSRSAMKAEKSGSAPMFKGQADIVFVIDTTGSMSDVIYNVAQNVNLFVTNLSEKYNAEASFALVDFRDIEEDGSDSTRVVKNGSSNWFSDAKDFKSVINGLMADGGGDTPESDIDALESARRLNFRRDAEKYIILITDADYKIANNYGISSMSEEITKLKDSGINVSVVCRHDDQNVYRDLYTSTGGIWADIEGNFSNELLNIADQIGEDVSSGTWVLLRGYKYVRLDADPAEGRDTDGDNVPDIDELGSLKHTNVDEMLTAYLRSRGVSDKYIPSDTSVYYYDYISNPVMKDTDSDGISDKTDSAPLQKGIKGGYVGELSIVSCHPNGGGFTDGHAWVSYKSYVKDSLNVQNLMDGYVYDDFTFINKKIKTYSINTSGHVALGAACTLGGTDLLTTIDGSAGGIMYNREFQGILSDNNKYPDTVAYTKKITDAQLSSLIKYCANNSYYNVYTHNCSSVASEAWTAALGKSNRISASYDDTEHALVGGFNNIEYVLFDTPKVLKENILKNSDVDKNYSRTMLNIISNWK